MTHLDTSFLVDLLREAARGKEGPAHAVLDRLAEEELAVSVHVPCELYAGAELADDPEVERDRVTSLLKALQVVHTGDRFAPLYGAPCPPSSAAEERPSQRWTCSSRRRHAPTTLPSSHATRAFSSGCRGWTS